MDTNILYNMDCRQGIKGYIQDNSLDCVLTSPPYNLNINYNSYSDNLDYNLYLKNILSIFQLCYSKIKTGGRLIVNVPSITINKKYIPLYSDLIQELTNIGYIMRNEIIWNKKNISKRTSWGSWKSPSNPKLLSPYEYILIFSKESLKHDGDNADIDISKEEFIKYTNSIWEIPPETNRLNHPAPFPIMLVTNLLKMFTYRHDLILDPFMGSGTTAVACIQNKRNYIGFELDRKYFDISNQRIKEEQNQLKLF